MTDVNFDRLRDVSLRDAWRHEGLDFTPWLAANINHIAEVVGVPLELTGTEVSVGGFAADILARNSQDDSVVLIENQLEQTAHTHLGQIMTYLAGLEAKTVIWIAPTFREPHLSAIRWLNQHTADGFSFFALRLRVVRIGESPYAPIFEVVEKPNDWDRRLQNEVGLAQNNISSRRAAFWTAYLQRHPSVAAEGFKAGKESNKWLRVPPPGTILGFYLASQTCGVYLRGPPGSSFDEVLERFLPFRENLERQLGVPLTSQAEPGWLLVSKIPHPISDEENWPKVIDWMEERRSLYCATLADLFGVSR